MKRMKTVRIRLEDRQMRLLEQASRATRISKASLVRRGIDLILRQEALRAELEAVNRRHGKTLKALGE